MPQPIHEVPYPGPQLDIGSISFRLHALEEWKRAIEQDQLPKMLAIMDERQRNDHEDIVSLKATVATLMTERDRSQGFKFGSKTLIVVVGGFLLMAGNFIVQLIALGGP